MVQGSNFVKDPTVGELWACGQSGDGLGAHTSLAERFAGDRYRLSPAPRTREDSEVKVFGDTQRQY